MAYDVKGQAYRGDLGPEYWDFRGDGNVGSPADEHRTAFELENVDDATFDILTNPERLAEFVQPGDNALVVANRVIALFTSKQPSALANLATLLGLAGHGPVKFGLRAYDE